jgi:cell division protein FtsL
VASGVVVIAVVAALLAGIVALNVAVLRLNVEAERLDAERAKLSEQHDVLVSELSRAAAAGRISAIAVGRLGLERPVETTYVRLGRSKH